MRRATSFSLLLLCTFGSALAAFASHAPGIVGSEAALPAGLMQTNSGQWTWIGGDEFVAEKGRIGVYGTKGVAAQENVPGARRDASAWRDGQGNLWLFGGWGYGRYAGESTLNDLWKFDGVNWTWVAGSDLYARTPIHGTKGVPDPANDPGGRYGAASWIDASGHLWLFGGANRLDEEFSDLWQWDGTAWTWVSGPNVPKQIGVYGTRGVGAPENRPGARRSAAFWTDGNGAFWLFGGRGFAGVPTGASGHLNDLWKWDGATWTWMSGSGLFSQAGVYGTKGVASPTNTPGGRIWATSSVGPDGRFWLFGGLGPGSTGWGLLNDLWVWDGAMWTWVSGSDVPGQAGVYGTKGVAAASNVPGGRRSAASWVDASENVWILGGTVLLNPAARADELYNDLWKWDGTNWVWMRGSETPGAPGIYGEAGVPAPANGPGARYAAMVFAGVSGDVAILGGNGSSETGNIGPLNDLWSWDGTQWAWRSGSRGASQAGVYGTRGLPGPANRPGARQEATVCRAANGEVYLFGGYGFSGAGQGYLNDLWRWDGSNWTWLGGSSEEDQPGVAGTKGVPAPGNVPGGRSAAASWIDATGDLWVFGGSCPPSHDEGATNDLWRWDGAMWTWMSGATSRWEFGRYGTRGVPDASNVPGARHLASAWRDPAGDLWLFGGYGVGQTGGGTLNDLWRWDGAAWTWIHGSSSAGALGERGALGVPAPDNSPSSLAGATAAAGPDGVVWLFGGWHRSQIQNYDLWRWDGSYWTRFTDGQGGLNHGVYGEKGVSAPWYTPGRRMYAASWVDERGHFWVFGGQGSTTGGVGYLNDLWRWDGAGWAWMHGSNDVFDPGVYGDGGVPGEGNGPGGRHSSAATSGASGTLLLLGGFGTDSTGTRGTLPDLWSFSPPACSPPAVSIVAPDSVLDAGSAHAASVPDAGPDATYEWSVEGASLDAGQGSREITFTATAGAPSIVVGIVVRKGDCAAEARKTIPVGLYYRLDVVRNGTGGDIVTASGGSIECGLRCSAVFASGTSVNLGKMPSPRSRFAGWLGGGCSGTGNCTVTMDGPKTVSATFFPTSPAGFYPVTPCRIVDTRNAAGSYGAPPLAAGASRLFVIGGQCGVPSDAAAVALNVTVTAPTESGSLTLHPGSGPAPETASIHFAAGRTRANNVTMGLAEGALSVLDRQATGTVELIVDVSGYYR